MLPALIGVRAHDAEQESAVGGKNRRRAETIVDRRRRPAPSAPGGKARIVGFEIAPAKHAVRHGMVVQQQHAAVPQRRLLALTRGKPGIDLGAPLGRKSPWLWRESKLQAVKVNDGYRLGHGDTVIALTASNTLLGSTISCCAATIWISRAPSLRCLGQHAEIRQMPRATAPRRSFRCADSARRTTRRWRRPPRSPPTAAAACAGESGRSRPRRADRSRPPACPRHAAR